MSKFLLAVKDVNYGASKGSATKNTAGNDPYELRNGALGIFGIHKAGSTNLNKMVLIGDGGSESAGYVPAASFVGDRIFFAVGTADGVRLTEDVQVANAHGNALVYVAPVRKAWAIGHNRREANGTLGDGQTLAGSLNLANSPKKGDELAIKVNNLADKDEFNRTGETYSAYYNYDNEPTYNVLARLSETVKEAVAKNKAIHNVEVDVVAKGTITEFGQDATFTKGSKVVTFAGNVTVATGAFVTVNGAIYEAATGVTTGTSITLDRPFVGDTVTIDVSGTADHGGTIASITEYGLEVLEGEDRMDISVAVMAGLESASLVVSAEGTLGSGDGAYLYELEKDIFESRRGRLDNIDRRFPLPVQMVDPAVDYDLYILNGNNAIPAGDVPNGVLNSVESEIYLAFPDGIADNAGKNQSDFEDIVAELSFATAFPSII